MKIFAIRDDSDPDRRDLAYLLYYESSKAFYIEITDHMTEWDVPLILSSFVKRGVYTVNAYWSKVWVQQRIVPTDRQNLGQILADNGLEEYDEFQLLMLANGRCAQDDCYLARIDSHTMEYRLKKRFQKKVDDVLPLEDLTALLFFRDGTIRKCDFTDFFQANLSFGPLLTHREAFGSVTVQPGGYGIAWNDCTVISDEMLYTMGTPIPLSLKDFCTFADRNLISSAEAAQILGCTRQNIDDLIRRGKLHPVKNLPKNKLFLRSEIEARTWG